MGRPRNRAHGEGVLGTMALTRRVLLVSWLVACGRLEPRVSHSADGMSPADAGLVAPEDGGAAAGKTLLDASAPVAEGRANPALFSQLEGTDVSFMTSSARTFGFSKDDVYLGYTVSTCDPCPLEFHFTSPTKPAIDLAFHYDPQGDSSLSPAAAEARAKKDDDEVRRKLAELGAEPGGKPRALRGPFPYPDLIFAQAIDRAPAIGKASLLFGARVGGYAPVFPVRLELGPHPMFDRMPASSQAAIAKLPPAERAKEWKDWHAQWLVGDPVLAYANVTRDGAELGVVAITTGTMWWEEAKVARVPVPAFVAHVYNGTGMRLHQSRRWDEAAPLFEKAEAAQPAESLFSYNLACAWARAGDPRAKDALGRAVQKGGAAIKDRAARDADFATVTNEPWFQAAVHP